MDWGTYACICKNCGSKFSTEHMTCPNCGSADVLVRKVEEINSGKAAAEVDNKKKTFWDDKPPEPEKSLNGIGGWLLLFIIRLCLGLITAIAQMRNIFEIAYYSDIGFYVFAFLCSFVLSIISLVLLFKRKILFRTIYVFSVVSAVVALLSISAQASTVVASIISDGCWIVYLFSSRRVAITFGQIPDPTETQDIKEQVDKERDNPPLIPSENTIPIPDEKSIYCKYCGKKIDNDSVFCRYCGKQQV